jgi:hypothetical protein
MSGFAKLIRDVLQEGVRFIFIRNECSCLRVSVSHILLKADLVQALRDQKGIAFELSPLASHELKGIAFRLQLAVSRHLNLYRFNSLARILRAWPDYPEAKNG